MKNAWIFCIPFIFLCAFEGYGQDCSIGSKANDILPDRLCSPVEVEWEVIYRGVNDAGTTVEVLYTWDDGSSETVTATEIDAATSTWRTFTTHTYVSDDDRCNYLPEATLVVNGVVCTSSAQEQIVTVWDNDDTNGGRVNASPNVYPICVGQGATMRFDDNTRFNCVPPQENDVPNTDTRWIQWVYGTSNSMSSSTPVMVDGAVRAYPFYGPVIELPGPVTGSSEQSLPITVADDNLVGEEFEVELRYWNFCNPYPTDPPVTDRSVIRIVDLPDATITPVDTFCEFNDPVFLSAATGGGTWNGPGITDPSTGEFSPFAAGPGDHLITYEVTDGNGCSGTDTELITVREAPDAEITPAGPFCTYDPAFDLEVSAAQGTWGGTGIADTINGIFVPAVAGPGIHSITFTTEPDPWGCYGIDTLEVEVVAPPDAWFLTPDSVWCETGDNRTTAGILVSGSGNSYFDLVLDMGGTPVTLEHVTGDTVNVVLDNQTGTNLYRLLKVIEYHGGTTCETLLDDSLIMEVYPLPDMHLTAGYDGLCSPVAVAFTAVAGYDFYFWDFGDGTARETRNNVVDHTYVFEYPHDPADTAELTFRPDTAFHYRLIIETLHGCRDSTGGDLLIYPNPVADFFVTPEIQSYPETGVTLVNLSSWGDWSYLWDFGDGETDTVRDPGGHEFPTHGFFDIELKTYSPHCRDSISKRVQILPPPPVAEFEPDTVGCPPLEISFTNYSVYADTYIWDFDDGTFSSEPGPTHTFYKSKEHHVKLTAYGLSGTDTTERIVRIHDTPQAVFSAYPTTARNLKQIFKFVNNSARGSYYLWDFGDGNTSAEENPSHIYGVEGTFDVTLYAWSEDDCPDTTTREAYIRVIAGEGEVEFPNVFRWNGTGPTGGYWKEGTIDNTVFHPNIINAVDFRMIIYTRWGEMIYETNEINKGWDGYLDNGKLASQGVYVYKAFVTYISGDQEIIAGDVTFLH
ncbi:MAG TPA: PKD domain-containing protein [Bacteroides sp.]|nr:PKD domain-containing protein [Bacteroides sp.]